MLNNYEKYDSKIPLEVYEEKTKDYKHIISDFDGTLVILEIDWYGVIENTNSYLRDVLNYPVKVESFWELTFKYSSLYLKHKKELDSFIKKKEDEMLEKKAWKKINFNLWKLLEKREFSILSNNMTSTIEAIMVEENLIPSIVVGRDKVNIPKPETDGVRFILETFNLKKEEVIMIGDTKWDKLTAERAGIAYFGVADRDV